MNKLFFCIVIAWAISACAANQPRESAAPAAVTAQPLLTLPPAYPTPASSEQATAALVQAVPGLSGALILISSGGDMNSLVRYDLAQGSMTKLFQAPAQSWLAGEAISPNNRQILLAYTPPPPAGKTNFGYTDLYLLPADGSTQPVPYLERQSETESYFNPTWSPDGNSIYFAHFFYTDPKTGAYTYQIERIGKDKKVEILVKSAYWPQLSPDGKKLAYLSFDPLTKSNELYLADANGQNVVPLLPPGSFPAVDAIFFSPDGSTITFSAVNTQTSSTLNWWELFSGIQVASAHNIPSDWYRVPINGGPASRLTRLNDTGLFGRYSPDGKHIAFICSTGIYLMDEDGGSLNRISSAPWLGTLDWIP